MDNEQGYEMAKVLKDGKYTKTLFDSLWGVSDGPKLIQVNVKDTEIEIVAIADNGKEMTVSIEIFDEQFRINSWGSSAIVNSDCTVTKLGRIGRMARGQSNGSLDSISSDSRSMSLGQREQVVGERHAKLCTSGETRNTDEEVRRPNESE